MHAQFSEMHDDAYNIHVCKLSQSLPEPVPARFAHEPHTFGDCRKKIVGPAGAIHITRNYGFITW